MEHSMVYLNLNYLASIRNAMSRRQLLRNITANQMKAVCEVAKRIVNGTINPLRRDVRLFNRLRLVLRSLASDTVTFATKKGVLRRYRTLLPVLLREMYIIQTIMDEIRHAIIDHEQ